MKTTTTKDRTAATTSTAVFNSMDSDYQLSREDQSDHGETKDWTFKTQAPVQFSSRWYLCARKSPYALHPVSQKFPQRRQGNSSNVRLTDDGRLSSFQGRSSSASSFHASLLQAIDGVMSLAMCPQVVSSFSTFQIFREARHLGGLLCLPGCVHVQSFPFTLACTPSPPGWFNQGKGVGAQYKQVHTTE